MALSSMTLKAKAAKPISSLFVTSTDTRVRYKQPYETEINAAKTPPNVLVKADPIRPLPFDATTATFVDTLDAVVSMLEHLKRSQEIAIDLEHHDEHSYIGLVSLMQISTRDKDWVVDTLKPWRQDLQILNEVFADPNTVKVSTMSRINVLVLTVIGFPRRLHGHGLAST